jgi:demethylmenaquinone methyltransferase/2-methoxy-6-polyprenyl-1,4-benzoquinol methylase
MTEKVTPYKDGNTKKDQVKKMFDSVAWRYDMLNRMLSLGIDIGWRKKLIKQMSSFSPNLVLDMATGTADLAIMAAKKIPQAQIIGIDLSPNMVQIGNDKVKKNNLDSRVQLKTGDSEDINDSDNTYDAAMVAFGVRNYENLDKGLTEMHRVLKKGAPLFILEFSKPTIFPVKQVFNLYFSTIVPLIGKLFSKDPSAYRYLYDSVQAFPDFDQMQNKLEEIGFKECKWESLSFGICCLYRGIK